MCTSMLVSQSVAATAEKSSASERFCSPFLRLLKCREASGDLDILWGRIIKATAIFWL